MKNLKIPVFLIVFAFIFSFMPYSIQAVSATHTISGVKQEKSTIGKKITSLFTKLKTKIQKVLNSDKEGNSLFWVWATLLILAGVILGVALVFIAFSVAIVSTAPSSGAIALLLLVLGFLLPIVLLFLAFRPLLRNHFRKIGQDISKRKINIYALLLSLAPGVLGLLWVLTIFIS